MEHMVSLYNADGDGKAMIPYCPTNYQPHMRAVPEAGQPKELFQWCGDERKKPK
jgi:hypothetical protein